MSEFKKFDYRILAHEENGEIYFMVHRVFYENGSPSTYGVSAATAIGKDMNELEESLGHIFGAHLSMSEDKIPILWAGEKFPKIYEGKKYL